MLLKGRKKGKKRYEYKKIERKYQTTPPQKKASSCFYIRFSILFSRVCFLKAARDIVGRKDKQTNKQK